MTLAAEPIHLFDYSAIGSPVCGRAAPLEDTRCVLGAAEELARERRTVVCEDCRAIFGGFYARSRWRWRAAPYGDDAPPPRPPAATQPPASDDASDAQLLGVGADVGRRELRRAYRRALRAHHPDRGGSSEAFRERSAAYARMCERRGWA